MYEIERINRWVCRLTFFTLSLPFFGLWSQTDSLFSEAEQYTTKKFDVAIFPTGYKGLIGGANFTPTRKEVNLAEKALKTNLKNLNKELKNQSSTPIIHKNLKKYKRQYFGYIDKNGDRILFINCFWSKRKDLSKYWLKEFIRVLDGGSYFWSIKYNINEDKIFSLSVNGYA